MYLIFRLFDISAPCDFLFKCAVYKNTYLLTYLLVASVCSELQKEDNNLDVLRTDTGRCYVVYSQTNSLVKRTWYAARNKCLLLNGDLATTSVTSAKVVLNLLRPNIKYWIGLQRDPLRMPFPGTFDHDKMYSVGSFTQYT